MSIRIRRVDGYTVAICAARSVPKEGDIYLDDGAHHALSVKFDLDYASVGFKEAIHASAPEVPLMEREESSNPNRTWWDQTYGSMTTNTEETERLAVTILDAAVTHAKRERSSPSYVQRSSVGDAFNNDAALFKKEPGILLTEARHMIGLPIPFRDLVPDNQKYGVVKGRMILSAKYRRAKDTIAMIALRDIPASHRPLSGRLALDAVLHEPDRKRVRDPQNYTKLVCDALQNVLYENDGQIDDARWRRGSVDVENPRLHLTLWEIPT